MHYLMTIFSSRCKKNSARLLAARSSTTFGRSGFRMGARFDSSRNCAHTCTGDSHSTE